MNRFLFSIFILLTLSCSSKKSDKIVIDHFTEKKRIIGNPIKNIEVFSGGNVNLKVIDSFLVIQRMESPFFKIYSTKSHELLAEFGNEGRGPDDFISPELLNQTKYLKTVPIVTVYDYKRRRFSEINLINAVKAKGEIILQKKIPKTAMQLNYFHYWDDNFLLAAQADDGRFVIYNNEKPQYENIPYIPETEFEIKKGLKPYIYKSVAIVNKDLNRIAMAPIFLGQIDF